MKSRLSKSSFNLRPILSRSVEEEEEENDGQVLGVRRALSPDSSLSSLRLNNKPPITPTRSKHRVQPMQGSPTPVRLFSSPARANSKSVFNLHSRLETESPARTPAKRKNSINLKQILLDKLLSKSGSLANLHAAVTSPKVSVPRNESKFSSNASSLSTLELRSAVRLTSTDQLDATPKSEVRKKNKYNKYKMASISALNKAGRSHSLNDLSAFRVTDDQDGQFDWKLYGDAYQQEIRDRRHEMYITEIEMDNMLQTGPTLRAIYDGDEYEKFMERLDMRIKAHDKDIERMCNAHYQGFVDCIHELLKVRPQSDQLKKGVIEINQEIQKSSENIQRKAEELIKFRRILCNTESTIEHLTVCLPVLEMYGKLMQQMKEDKYYPALKTLEQLEKNYFPRIEKYRWAQAMIQKIPQVRDHIKNASMTDLKDFLEMIRKLSIKIGEVAMRNAAAQQNIDDSILNGSSSESSVDSSTQNLSTDSTQNFISKKANKLRKRKAPAPPIGSGKYVYSDEQNNNELLDNDSSSIDDELAATDLVDFSPVYRCLQIYTCLGARDTFEHYYRQQRQQQAKLALQAPMNMHESLEGYRNYFCGIVGFFVIEDHILSTGNGLISKEYLDSIWQTSLQSIIASLRTHIGFWNDAKLMLRIKRMVILFIYTLQSYGYNVSQLFRLLVEIRDQYNQILMKQWVTVFRTIFDADNYHPMVVNNIKELNDLLMEFPFYEVEALNLNGLNDTLETSMEQSKNEETTNSSLDQSDTASVASSSASSSRRKKSNEFPKKFPFSSFVPKVFREVKQFIHACLEFSADLNSSQSEIEDMVRKSTNILLTRTLSGCLSSLIKKPNLGLLQLIQITINTNYLEEASIYLEEYISKTIGFNYSNMISGQVQPLIGGLHLTDVGDEKKSALHSSASSQHLARLQGKSMFKDARADAESQIYLQLNQKIDEFLELASYDWLIADSNGLASVYISDLIAFLRSTFEAFTNLPLKVAQTACHSACRHIANQLMGFLMDEEVKCISLGALTQFNLDLLQCEVFAGSEPVRGFEDGDLLMCFSELRQLMDLFMLWDWNIYIADFGKQHGKYLRVSPVTALNLLEKVREADKKKSILLSLKKNERDKKRLTDTVIKQLKTLAAGTGTAT